MDMKYMTHGQKLKVKIRVFMAMAIAGAFFISITSPKAWADCFNHVRDADEEGIDCGGVCDPCQPLIINHTTAANFDRIPPEWVERAKDFYKVSYGHTSHGSQVVTGMTVLRGDSSYSELCNFYDDYGSRELPFGALSFWDRRMSGAADLGNPDRTSWATATRNHLNGIGSDRNLIIWSWCGQVNGSEANIDTYLNLMSQLELDYPDVTFIYMTGHLNGGGPSGSVYARNNQIRNFCLRNNKVLFDFADIESWDPAGVYYPNENDGCNWCTQWCNTHDCDFCTSGCAHSHCFNCYQKGKAFWYMMARLAGWDDTDTPPPVRYGDINNDNEVTAFDASLTAHIAVGLNHQHIVNRAAADVNGDNGVTAYDAALIAQYAVGIIDRFPRGG